MHFFFEVLKKAAFSHLEFQRMPNSAVYFFKDDFKDLFFPKHFEQTMALLRNLDKIIPPSN